jgi:hypothetical protein
LPFLSKFRRIVFPTHYPLDRKRWNVYVFRMS